MWRFGDPIPQNIYDGINGFIDGATFGLTDLVRDLDGSQGYVDKCSDSFIYSEVAGEIFSSAIGAGGVTKIVRPRKGFLHGAHHNFGTKSKKIWRKHIQIQAEKINHRFSTIRIPYGRPYKYKFGSNKNKIGTKFGERL